MKPSQTPRNTWILSYPPVAHKNVPKSRLTGTNWLCFGSAYATHTSPPNPHNKRTSATPERPPITHKNAAQAKDSAKTRDQKALKRRLTWPKCSEYQLPPNPHIIPQSLTIRPPAPHLEAPANSRSSPHGLIMRHPKLLDIKQNLTPNLRISES